MFGFVASRLGLSFWDFHVEAKSLMGGVLSACPIPGASRLLSWQTDKHLAGFRLPLLSNLWNDT